MLSVRTRLCPSLSYAQTFVLIADAPGSSTQHIAAAAQVPQNRSRKSNRTSAKASVSGPEPSQPDTDASDEDDARDSHGEEGEGKAGPRADQDIQNSSGQAVTNGKSLEELAVRFSQATKELQVSCGICVDAMASTWA